MGRFTPRKDDVLSVWLPLFYRLVQMVMGIVVIGLYAQDLNRAHKEHKYSDGKWVYAVVVGSFGAVTGLVYMIVTFLSNGANIGLLFGWDLILFLLWTALFGIFGHMYINEKVEMEPGIQRMKSAVWCDLTNMLLWFLSGLWGAWVFWRSDRRSLHRNSNQMSSKG